VRVVVLRMAATVVGDMPDPVCVEVTDPQFVRCVADLLGLAVHLANEGKG
jgi:hypothetical protein